MDVTIIHHNDRVWGRVWLHLVKEAINELVESVGIESAFNNITVEDSLSQGEGRED